MKKNAVSDVFNFDDFEFSDQKKKIKGVRQSETRVSKSYTKNSQEQMMDVVYDEQLKCYYNPKTSEYYDLKNEWFFCENLWFFVEILKYKSKK